MLKHIRQFLQAALVAFFLIPATSWGQTIIIPGQGMQGERGIPPFMMKCMGHMALTQGFWTYRAAGLDKDEALVSLDHSMRIMEYMAERAGRNPTTPYETVFEFAKNALEEVYAFTDEEFKDTAFQQQWSNAKMQECIDANRPESPPDNRMVPKKGNSA